MNMSNNIEIKLVEDYWVNKLKGVAAVSLPAMASCTVQELGIGLQETGYFKKLTGGKPLAVFTVVLSIYAFLLGRYFPAYNGFVYSGDSLQKEQPPGYPLLFLIKEEKSDTLKALVNRTKAEVQETYGHSNYNAAAVNKRAGIKGFESLTHFGLSVNPGTDELRSSFRLNVYRTDGGDLKAVIQYLEGLTSGHLVGQFLQSFSDCLANLEEMIDIDTVHVPLQAVKEETNAPQSPVEDCKPLPVNATIVELVEEQARRTPNALAVMDKGVRLRYCDLNENANRLAHHLARHYNIKSGDAVGLLLPPAGKALNSILGILKTGAVLLPIDPACPAERINFLTEDSNMKLLVAEGTCSATPEGAPLLNLAAIDLSGEQTRNPETTIAPEDNACFIYASAPAGDSNGVIVMQDGPGTVKSWDDPSKPDKAPYSVSPGRTTHCAVACSECADIVFACLETLERACRAFTQSRPRGRNELTHAELARLIRMGDRPEDNIRA
jgi:non-ribosomal peptide synthetase component F